MLGMEIHLEGDGCWPDLPEKAAQGKLIHVSNDAPPFQVAALGGGMQSGGASVSFRFDLPDGTTVLVETSLALFLMAADMFRERYGDPRERRP
jgi:hypothetical protein